MYPFLLVTSLLLKLIMQLVAVYWARAGEQQHADEVKDDEIPSAHMACTPGSPGMLQ